MLRAKCPQCGFDLDEVRLAGWRAFDRMTWCLGVSAMGFICLVILFLVCAILFLGQACDRPR